jgi:hypothetical protein
MTSAVMCCTVLRKGVQSSGIHPRFSQRGPLAWALLLVLALIAPSPVAAQEPSADQPLPTIDEVRSHVDETLGSIVTAMVKYRRSQSIDPESPVDLAGVDSIDWQDYVWTWWMDGEQRAMESEPKQFADSERWSHVYRTFDGRRQYQAGYSREDPQRMTKLTILPEPDVLLHDFTVETWLGLHLTWTDQTLLSLLDRPDASVAAWEPVGGSPCVHVELGSGRSRTGDELSWSVWLDPARDWLPRRIMTRWDAGTLTTNEEVRTYTQEVNRFRRVSDRLLERDRWFPEQFFGRFFVRADYEVLDVAVNEASPPNLFAIEPRPGTEVTDRNLEDPRASRVWVQGGSAELADIRGEIVEEARNMAPGGGASADAAPRAASSLATYTWLMAALLAVTAVLVWWRR